MHSNEAVASIGIHCLYCECNNVAKNARMAQQPNPWPQDNHPAPQLLFLDVCGRVINWIHWQDAVCLYARDAVSWTLGAPCLHIHGGYNRLQGARSVIALHPIIAARGQVQNQVMRRGPTLTNAALFTRDDDTCLYCGRRYPRSRLSRDHVLPISQGG